MLLIDLRWLQKKGQPNRIRLGYVFDYTLNIKYSENSHLNGLKQLRIYKLGGREVCKIWLC